MPVWLKIRWKLRHFGLILGILCILVFFSNDIYAVSWEYITKKHGVGVFRRKDPNSSMLEFKGQGYVDAHASKIITLLQDVRLMPEWIEGCVEGHELEKNYSAQSYKKKISEFYIVYYGVNDAPWPVTDRDYVLKGKISYIEKNDTIILDLRDIKHPKKPPQPGLIRMNFMKVKIALHPDPKNNNRTWVQFYVHLDPAGWLPAWVVNFVSKNIPLNTIRKLRKLVKRNKYDKELEKLVIFRMRELRKKKNSK
jgi:hypothetical protein